MSKDAQQLVAALEGLDQWWAVATDPPWWIDPANATAGPIETQLSGEQVEVSAAVLRTVADVLQEMGAPVGADGKVRLSRTRALALDSQIKCARLAWY